MTSNFTCRDDFDCLQQREVCYDGVEWAPANASFCACDGYYGYQGSDCLQPGPQTIFWIISQSCLVLASIFLAWVYAFPCMKMVLERANRSSPIFYTVLMICAYYFFQILAALLYILDVVDTNGYGDEFSLFGTVKHKKGKWWAAATIANTVAFLFYFVFNINIALVWIDVAYSTKKMSLKGESVVRYRRFLRVIQIAFVTVYGIGSLVDPYHVILVASILNLTVAISYVYARRWILSLRSVGTFHSSDSAMASIFTRIQITSRRIIGWMLLTCCLGFSLAVWGLLTPDVYFSLERQLMQPEKVNPISVFNTLFSFLLSINSWIVGSYLKLSLTSRPVPTASFESTESYL
mmetsp:Transcript_5675/g.6558  ORF Transcript_5675/g.6558 Transcript_5675/m.6558 type:complete len:350 (+) Transcript_5675:159-1208(+)